MLGDGGNVTSLVASLAMGEGAVSSRLQWVDRARAISIILVVLLHTRLELGFVGVESEVVDVVDMYGLTMRMPLFFAAAGLFAGKWIAGSWRDLLTRKIALLGWVFLAWQPVVFAYKMLEMIVLPNQPENDWSTQLAKLLVSPIRPNGELWFLWALCLFFVIAKVTLHLPMLVRLGAPALVSILWSSFAAQLLPDAVERALGDGWAGLAKFYVFFVVAVAFAPPIVRAMQAAHWALLAAIVGAWILATSLLAASSIPGVRFVLSILGVAAGFSLARMLPIPGLAILGSRTLPIYVAHTAVIVTFVSAAHLFGLGGALATTPTLSTLSTAAAAILASLLLQRVLQRWQAGRLMYAPPAIARTSAVRIRR